MQFGVTFVSKGDDSFGAVVVASVALGAKRHSVRTELRENRATNIFRTREKYLTDSATQLA